MNANSHYTVRATTYNKVAKCHETITVANTTDFGYAFHLARTYTASIIKGMLNENYMFNSQEAFRQEVEHYFMNEVEHAVNLSNGNEVMRYTDKNKQFTVIILADEQLVQHH